MWPLDQISGLIWRFTRPRMPDLVVDERGFSLCKSGNVLERYFWEEVGRVVAFKRDHGTYDEICLQIDIRRRVGALVLSEEFGSYQAFTAEMEKKLPGINQGWWWKVAFPAFEENATVLFLRENVGEQRDTPGPSGV
jgi:hypothetical protein